MLSLDRFFQVTGFVSGGTIGFLFSQADISSVRTVVIAFFLGTVVLQQSGWVALTKSLLVDQSRYPDKRHIG